MTAQSAKFNGRTSSLCPARGTLLPGTGMCFGVEVLVEVMVSWPISVFYTLAGLFLFLKRFVNPWNLQADSNRTLPYQKGKNTDHRHYFFGMYLKWHNSSRNVLAFNSNVPFAHELECPLGKGQRNGTSNDEQRRIEAERDNGPVGGKADQAEGGCRSTRD